jgi:hypothetical protein
MMEDIGMSDELPSWLECPKDLPPAALLQMDAIMVASFGRGFSAIAMGQHLPLRLVVMPVPGALPSDTDERKAAVDATMLKIEAGTGQSVRLTVVADIEPAVSFQGFLAGFPLRDGCKEIGVARIPSPVSDNW